MANAYSAPAQYNDYISPVDMQQVETTLAVKGAKYQANVVKIESQIEAMGNAPLLRDSDKQMLADNMKNITSQINQMSKMQLSRGTASLEATKAIKGAITPYIADQMALARGFQEDQKMLNEKRQKNPELYSDTNYTDALEQSGYYEYMKGGTNSFNRIQYVDAYDMSKLDDKVQKWAKDFGKNTGFSSETQGGITTITKFQELSQADVKAFIEHAITADNHLAKQLQINSRQSFKNYSDEQFKESYVETIRKNVEENDIAIKSRETLIGNYAEGSEERKFLQGQIDNLNSRNEEYQKEIDGKIPYNRQVAQSRTYMTSFIGGYVDTYAKKNVIDIDQNTYAFDIEYKTANLALKEKELSLKERELNKEAQDAGTPFEMPTNIEGDKASSYSQAESSYKAVKGEAWRALQSDPIFASAKSDAEREQIYQDSLKNSDSYDVTSGKYSQETFNKLQLAKAEKEKLNKYTISVANFWKPKIEELYNGIGGGLNKDLNVNNLKLTMPFTAGLIANGKTDFSKLTRDQKNAVYAEVSENLRDTVAGGDADILDQLNIVAKGYRGILPKGLLPENKKIESQLGTFIGSAGGLIGNTFVSAFARPLIGLTQGEEAMNKYVSENNKRYKQIKEEGDRAFYNTALKAVYPFTPDTDLGSLQERDISLGSEGVKGWFKKVSGEAKDKFTPELNSMTGIKINRGVTFANIEKNEKPFTNAIAQLASTKGLKVNKDSQYSYYKEGNNYFFTVDVDNSIRNVKGTGMITTFEKQTFSIPEHQVPSILTDKIGEGSVFVEDKTNFRYRPPKNSEEANTYTMNIIKSTGISDPNLISATEKNILTFDQIAKPYHSRIKPEYSNWYKFLEKAEFQTKVVKTAGGGYKSVLQMKNSEGSWNSLSVESPVSAKYDPSGFIAMAPALVQKYLEDQMKIMIE